MLRPSFPWLFGLLAAACGAPARPPLAPLEREASLAAGVQPERAASRVRALCGLGPRMGGTASGAAAAEFVALALADHGLDVRIERDPPRRAHAESAWELVARSETGERRVLASAWPYGFSPTAAGSAPLALEDGPGRALLVESRGRATPAAALVLVDGDTSLDGRWPVVQHLRGRGPHAPHFGLSHSDGEWLRAQLAAGRALAIDFALAAEIGEAEVLTVVARLPAREPTGPAWGEDHVLVCAHGDSDAGGPGANDNASGVAALIEVAAAWREGVSSGLIAAPPREVRFAVWGAEIHSSRAYLERRRAEGVRVLGVVNFDQSGFGSSADRVYVEPDDLPANVGLARALLGVLADHAPRRDAGAPGEFPREWASVPSLGGTDSYVFSEALADAGAPAITVYSSAWGRPAEHPRTPGMPGESWRERDAVEVDHDVHYHSAGDTPENTTDREPWNAAWCARVALLGLRRWLAGGSAAP
ncbi:MAG TPA: M28 family peptidase [Planctomycetota bacterium]|nr:M28 family peptidase [Planctomycetota bacterium]